MNELVTADVTFEFNEFTWQSNKNEWSAYLNTFYLGLRERHFWTNMQLNYINIVPRLGISQHNYSYMLDLVTIETK